MTEEKEFDSLDELFSKTFENLPENPGPNGWDAPSGRVWANIKTHLTQAGKGWTNGQWALLLTGVGLVTALAVLAFWPSDAGNQQPASGAVQKQEIAETPAPAVPAPENAPALEPGSNTTSRLKQATEKAPATPSSAEVVAVTPVETVFDATSGAGRPVPSGSQLLPGSKPVFPNTTERLRKEEAERRWKTPLQPLPPVWEKVRKNME